MLDNVKFNVVCHLIRHPEMISENAEFAIAALRGCKAEAGEALPLLLSLAADHVASGLSPDRILSAVSDFLHDSGGLTDQARNLCLLLLAELTMSSTSSLLNTVHVTSGFDQKANTNT